MYTHRKRRKIHIKRTSSIQLIHISLINTTMSFLSAISHKDVLSRIAQSSLQHNIGRGMFATEYLVCMKYYKTMAKLIALCLPTGKK